MCRRALVRLLVLLFMAQVLPLAATPYQFRGLDGDQLTDLAENLLSQDRLGEAAQILEQLELEEAGGTRRAFLQGLLAEAQGQYFIAADRFSAILEREPGLYQVRLHLARALYMTGKDSEANKQLDLARAGSSSREMSHSIQGFSQHRPWRFDAGISLVPDSNINGATSNDSVTIYDLPFKLDKSSQPRSGVGAAANFLGSYRIRGEEGVPIYLGVRGFLLHYREQSFNDDSIDFEIGPELSTSLGKLRVSATYLDRWYGGNPYQQGGGLRLNLADLAHRSWSYNLIADARSLHHPGRDRLNGGIYSTLASFSYWTDSGVNANLWLGAHYQDAEDNGYANRGARIGGGFSRELAWGVRAGIGVEFARTIYEDVLPEFGIKRSDLSRSFGVTMAKDNWKFYGFTPVFRLVKSGTESNLAMYETDKWRGEFRLARVF